MVVIILFNKINHWLEPRFFIFTKKHSMKKSTTIFLLAAIGTAALAYSLIRNANAKKRLAAISDEGYETASDILYPGKPVSSRLHYGPVIPNNE